MAVFSFQRALNLSPRGSDGSRNLSVGIKVAIAVSAVVFVFCLVLIIWRIFVRKTRNRGASEDGLSSASTVEKSMLDQYVETTLMDSSSVVKKPIRELPKFPGPIHSPPISSSGEASADRVPAPESKTKLSLRIDPRATAQNILRSPNRSASIQRPSVKGSTKPKNRLPEKILPRLMNVTATYIPSMSDELPIKLGEIVRMIEEYEDGWCLIQRVGRPDADKGVCPRFCLFERQEIIPRKNSHFSRPTFPLSTSAFPVSTYHK